MRGFSEVPVRQLFSALALVALLAGCSNPCEKLLDKLCGCPGERAKLACTEAKDRREARDKETPDNERCKAQLESFKCAQLN